MHGAFFFLSSKKSLLLLCIGVHWLAKKEFNISASCLKSNMNLFSCKIGGMHGFFLLFKGLSIDQWCFGIEFGSVYLWERRS